MYKQLIIFLFLFVVPVHSQINDTIPSNIADKEDSLSVPTFDSLSVHDSLITKPGRTKPDSLAPIQGEPLTNVSTIIDRRTILFNDYRYAGDLLRSFPLNFIRDQGFVGQPSETFIYGVGNSGISYLQDGVLLNNRFTNSLDLNHIQSEDIDSVEIVPSPRGFLYGPYNNPITVNFITRDFVSPQPYTRIKYYEGYFGEAMIDGKFNARIFKRWNFGFQLTNRKYDSTYTNSEFSIWQINSKLKYFLSNSVNISAYYGYVDSRVGLNGGVDVDSISRITDDINSILYEPLRAPVLYPNQKLETLQHNFVLRTLAKPFDDSQLDLSFYYRYELDELRDFRDSINYINNIDLRIYGTVLNYYFRYNFLNLELFGNYEKTEFDVNSSNLIENYSNYFYNLGGLLTLSALNKKLNFSLFYKSGYADQTDLSYKGFGSDLGFSFGNQFGIYAGYSLRQTYLSEEYSPTIEGGIKYNQFNLDLKIKYFKTEYPIVLQLLNDPIYWGDHGYITEGIGYIINYKFWIIQIETNTSYYFNIMDVNMAEAGLEKSNSLPEWQFMGGIYVMDIFFNDNLELKAGLKFNYTGKINTTTLYYAGNDLTIDPTNKLDFTLAGEIRKLAIFYFIWENIFDKQYYLTPYYPMPATNIRFGLAWELFN